MRPLLRSRPVRIGLALTVLAMGALGFVPLFDGPGYESALGAGLIVPLAVAITTALATSAELSAPIDALAGGLSIGAIFVLAAWATTLLHGLRAGFCDVLGGSEHFALGPGVGALIAGAWGAVAGEMARRRKRRRLAAVLLAVAGPLASIAVSVWRFYASPMIFAYDPFVGFFSGTLYDTIIDYSGLLSYRAGSACTLLAAVALAIHLDRGQGGRLRLVRRGPPVFAAAGVLLSLASVLANVFGYRLGHWQTASTIASTLGGRTEGVRCSMVHARGMRADDAARFVKDCDAHVAAHEAWFGAPFPGRITAFVFESAAQKGQLMGAADTFIAKPWRREVYVQVAGYPHPVLGHELAHAVAGAFGRGPFRIGGGLGGLLPDPGLVEGVAVAAAPPEGDLMPREWARAMKDLGILPRLERLFTLGFLGENAGVAYTVSGAFVGWVHDRFGPEAIRAWYGGRSVGEATGVPFAELEKQWLADLDTVVLPDAARAVAKARFDRPSVFGRRCPHVVDGCRSRAEGLRGAGDYEGAVALYERILDLDPHDDGTRVTIARTHIRAGKAEEGARALGRLADDPKVPRHIRDRALEDLGDAALVDGRGEEAAARYREVLSRTLDEDARRTLDVKIAGATEPRLRPAVLALLVGSNGRGPDRGMAMELLRDVTVAHPGGRPGAPSDDPADGLAWYLLGRQYLPSAQFEEAMPRLDRALALPIEQERVRVEAERLRLVIACALGDPAGAAHFYDLYAAHPEVSEAHRRTASALLQRCGGDRHHGAPEGPAR